MTKTLEIMWNDLSLRENWREFILPKCEEEVFYASGKAQAEALLKFNPMLDVVLDYGCGVGRVLRFITANKKIGVDISSTFLDRINDPDIIKVQDSGLIHNKIPKSSVDFIYSLMVFQHIPAYFHVRILRNLYRLLRPQGKMVIQFPRKKGGYYTSSSFVNVYTVRDLERYCRRALLTDYDIIEGNLEHYGDPLEGNEMREYFLVVRK